ncbi:MAG: AIM24 family protein [Lachnospiraceae bacterium]|nr:AIM24 family protein [Lachnospiraceae bacterium]
MFTTNLLQKSESRNVVAQKKNFSVLEYVKDISVTPSQAEEAYFASAMNVRKRQLIIDLQKNTGALVQAREIQLIIGDIEADTGIRGAGDFIKKAVNSVVTNESIVKPYYVGEGKLVLEPTYNYILLQDLDEWPDGLIIEDSMFLACEDTVEIDTISRTTLSSALLGREGFFNSVFYGSGMIALESPVPEGELIEVVLDDDCIKIDGNMAIAWSPNLTFTVQKSSKTLVGSAVTGEGFVNVYEGTGKVLIAPVRSNKGISVPEK